MRAVVADAAAEALYREASQAGEVAIYWLRSGDAHPALDAACLARQWAITAAGLYHEAQRLSGICPEHGDPWPCEQEGCV